MLPRKLWVRFPGIANGGRRDRIGQLRVMPDKIYDVVLLATTKIVKSPDGFKHDDFEFHFQTWEEWKKQEANEDYRVRVLLRTADGRKVNRVECRFIADHRWPFRKDTFSGKHYSAALDESWAGKSCTLLIDADGFVPVLTKEFVFSRRTAPIVVDLQPAVDVPVRGRVIDADGKPIAGARVRHGLVVTNQSTEFPYGAERKTDAEGRFELKWCRVGERLFVYADKKGIGGVESASFLLEKSAPLQLPDLQIPRPNQTMEGTVHNDRGEPMAGVVVKATEGFFGAPGPDSDKQARTDSKGHFRLEGLLPGKTYVTAEAPGQRMTNGPLETIAEAKHIQIFMGPSFDSK